MDSHLTDWEIGMKDASKLQQEWAAKGFPQARDNFQMSYMSENEINIKPFAYMVKGPSGQVELVGNYELANSTMYDFAKDGGISSLDPMFCVDTINALTVAIDRLTAERDDWRRQAWHETDVATVASEEIERIKSDAASIRERMVELECQRDDYLSREWQAEKAKRKAEAERDILQKKYDKLTGERFSDRVHTALKSRTEQAEAERDAAVADARQLRDFADIGKNRLIAAAKQARRCLAWACEQRPEFNAEYEALDTAIEAARLEAE